MQSNWPSPAVRTATAYPIEIVQICIATVLPNPPLIANKGAYSNTYSQLCLQLANKQTSGHSTDMLFLQFVRRFLRMHVLVESIGGMCVS